MARALIWVYPALVLMLGLGFEAWSFSQQAAANTYRNAPQCGPDVGPGCYRLASGRITSVQVSQDRDGEQDTVSIDTTAYGRLSATLRPSDSAAPHVRTGANVTVKIYGGQVTLVEVDGFDVPSSANPTSNQSQSSFDGWLLIGLGVVSFAIPIYRSRRRQTNLRSEVEAAEAPLEPEVLPSSTVGWSVRPRRDWTTLGRYGIVVALVLVVSARPLLDPARVGWAVILDSIVIVGVLTMLGLFLHNTRVFADRDQVGKTNLFGRTVRLPVHDVLRAERFSVSGGRALNRRLVFVRSDGRKAFDVGGPSWDYRRLERMCRSAGISLTGDYDDVVGAFRVNRRVPGTTGWSDVVFGLILVVLIVAFVVLLTGPIQR